MSGSSYVFRKVHKRIAARVFDALGGLIFFGKRKITPPTHPKKILLIRLDHMGDLFYASAVPKLIKESIPGSEVHFLTNAVGQAMLDGNPFVDKVWRFDAPWFSGGRGSQRASAPAPLSQLRNEQFDLVFSLRGDLRENYLTHRIRPKYSLGYGITGGGFFLHRTLARKKGVHENEHTLALLRAMKILSEKLEPTIYMETGEETRHRLTFSSHGVDPGNYVAIQMDAGAASKEWTLENFSIFLQTLEEKHPKENIVFLGTRPSREKWILSQIEKRPRILWKSLMGKTDVRELFYILKNAKAFIGPDSGPGHVSAHYGVPTLILYSGTNVLAEWASAREEVAYLLNPVRCAPCRLAHCVVKGHPCMSGIRPEAVTAWLEERLRED